MARRNIVPVDAQEQRQEKLRAALDTLEAGIAAIIDGESFARYLRVMARFHNYSVPNALLIQAQRPEPTCPRTCRSRRPRCSTASSRT